MVGFKPRSFADRRGQFSVGARLLLVMALAVAGAACVPMATRPERSPGPSTTAPRTTTTTTPPPKLGGDWHFEDVDGNGVAGAGRTADGTDSHNSAVTFKGLVHDFYTAYTTPFANRLRHAWIDGSGTHTEDLDGPGTGSSDGRTNDGIMRVSSAVVAGSTLHVFYVDVLTREIRHASFDGSTWTFETIPGADAWADQQISAVALNDRPHLLFGHEGQTLPQPPWTLRHVWYDGAAWQSEDLDGPGAAGGNGRVATSVGPWTVATSNGTTVDAFYQDEAHGGTRHAHFDGSTWSFDVVEQAGTVQPAAAVVANGVPHEFGYSPRFSTMVHDWFENGAWHGETIDARPDLTSCATAGTGTEISATIVGGAPAVFFRGNTGQLCGSKWSPAGFGTMMLDGNGSPPGNGRITALDTVGTAVTVSGSTLHVFYGNTDGASPNPYVGQLRHAVMS